MRFKAYITKDNNIFWTKNSTDKPSQQFFNNLMQNANWEDLGEITPTWINQFNGQIVVDGDEYTYLKLTDLVKNETKYYFIDSINKVLKNGAVVLDITLDVFCTYSYRLYFGWGYIDPVKINRCNIPEIYKYAKDSQLTPDPLLNLTYPLRYFYFQDVGSALYTNANAKPEGPDGYKFLYGKINNKTFSYKSPMGSKNTIALNNSIRIIKAGTKLLTLPLWDVYQTPDGYIYYFPIFTTEYLNDGSGDAFYWDFTEWGGSGTTQYAYNGAQWVDYIKDCTGWVNHYQGRFIIPFWSKLIRNCGAISITIEGDPKGNKLVIGFFHKVGIRGVLEDWAARYNYIVSYGIKFSNAITREANDLLHWYLIREIKTVNDKYNIGYPLTIKSGTPATLGILPWLFETNEQYNFMFSSSGFQYFRPSIFKFDYAISGPETLPVSTNSYIQYLSSVQSSQNAGMQIAKQDSIINGVQGGLNSVFGAVGSFMSGNILGGVSSLVNGGFGVAKSVLQYENKKRMLDAQNADKQRSATANKFQASNYISNYINGFNSFVTYEKNVFYYLWGRDGIFLMCPQPNTPTLEYLNSVVWESGYYCDIVTNTQTPLPSNMFEREGYPFIYWDINYNTEWVKRTFTKFNNELVEAISQTMNNPVRFWRHFPDYKTGYISDYDETNLIGLDESETVNSETPINHTIKTLPPEESETNEEQ